MSGALPAALYIPSQSQTPSYFSTDEFVEPTPYVYHCGTDRLLTVGHPYFSIPARDGGIGVPKVSPHQYRCLRLTLPDPNGQFSLPATNISNPDKHRLVWRLLGLEVTRGQPIGIGLAGAPLFNRARDVESPGRNVVQNERVNTAFDPKQVQIMVVGCAPAYGEHWSIASPCVDAGELPTKCPPIELTSSFIEDGDMGDIGFGAMDYGMLCRNRSDVPLPLVGQVSKYPDAIRMRTDATGDCCFYMVAREQVYCRRLWQSGGTVGEVIPGWAYRKPDTDYNTQNCAYLAVPSGSVCTTDTALFNRPYWLSQSQGHNNGVCWAENLFITILDNTRGGTLHITNVPSDRSGGEHTGNYDVANYEEYQRHTEEYEVSALFQLCRVPLRTDVLTHLYRHNPHVLTRWGISEAPMPGPKAEDRYRYLESAATRCPLPPDPPPPSDDPYAKLKFWTIDCGSRFSIDLSMFSLGRKYMSLVSAGARRKRPAAAISASPSSTGPSTPRARRAKRRRVAR